MSARPDLQLVDPQPAPARPKCPYRADRLRAARAAQELEFKDLERMTGHAASTVCRVLKGNAPNVSVQILTDIAKALGVEMSELFS